MSFSGCLGVVLHRLALWFKRSGGLVYRAKVHHHTAIFFRLHGFQHREVENQQDNGVEKDRSDNSQQVVFLQFHGVRSGGRVASTTLYLFSLARFSTLTI